MAGISERRYRTRLIRVAMSGDDGNVKQVCIGSEGTVKPAVVIVHHDCFKNSRTFLFNSFACTNVKPCPALGITSVLI